MKYELFILGIQDPTRNAPNMALSSSKIPLCVLQGLRELDSSEHASGLPNLCKFPSSFRVHVKCLLISDIFLELLVTVFS